MVSSRLVCSVGGAVPIERLAVGDRVLALDQSTGALVPSPVIAWLHRERRSTSAAAASAAPFEYLAIQLVRCLRPETRGPPPHSTQLARASSAHIRDREPEPAAGWDGCVHWSRLLVSPEHVLYTQAEGRVANYAKNVRVGQVLPSLFDFDLPAARTQSTTAARGPAGPDHSSNCQPPVRTSVANSTASVSESTGQSCVGLERRYRWELRVRAIERGVPSAEAYAPLTEAGTAFVDGALVSCYANHLPVEVAHAAFAPLRAVYRLRSALADAADSWSQHFLRPHIMHGANSTRTMTTTPPTDVLLGNEIFEDYSDRIHWYARVLTCVRTIWRYATVNWTLA